MSSASSAAGSSKSKTRTSSNIPLMRTGPSAGVRLDPTAPSLPPSISALPASHVVPSVRSDRLEEEAQRMETRLAALKVAMETEKAQREKIKRTKAGTFWKAAAPVAEGQSYMDDMKARIEKRVAKANALMASGKAPQQQSASGAAPAANRVGSAKPTSSSSSSSSSSSTDLAATQQRSSYAPPIQPKNAVSAPSAVRLQGSANVPQPAGGTTVAASAAATQPAESARKPIAASSNSPAAIPPSSGSNTGRAGEYVNPADDENRSAAPGSLLDGDFDEQANKAWFQAARQEWIDETAAASSSCAEAASSSAAAAPAKAGRVQLVHDPDYSPAVPASSSSSGGSGGSSLLDGPAFNERESARDFAEARKAWMQSLAEDKAGAAGGAGGAPAKHHRPSETAAQQSGHPQPDGMWNPSIALGEGGSILFPSEPAEGTTQQSARGASSTGAHPPTVSAALRSAQSGLEKTAKASCYQCYKLFYTQSASKRAEGDLPGRMFCSDACAEEALRTAKLRCSAAGCARSVLLTEGRRLAGKGNAFFCPACAANDGVHVAPTIPTASTIPASILALGHQLSSSGSGGGGGAGSSLASSIESIPRASSSPELEQEEEQEETEEPAADEEDSEEQQQPEDGPSIPSASSPVAASIRPISAELRIPAPAPPVVVLDTSVVHQAPTQAKATAAVVEFPSDDEEDEA